MNKHPTRINKSMISNFLRIRKYLQIQSQSNGKPVINRYTKAYTTTRNMIKLNQAKNLKKRLITKFSKALKASKQISFMSKIVFIPVNFYRLNSNRYSQSYGVHIRKVGILVQVSKKEGKRPVINRISIRNRGLSKTIFSASSDMIQRMIDELHKSYNQDQQQHRNPPELTYIIGILYGQSQILIRNKGPSFHLVLIGFQYEPWEKDIKFCSGYPGSWPSWPYSL